MRRDVLKAFAAVAAASLPKPAAAEVIEPKAGEFLALRFKECLSMEALARIKRTISEHPALKGVPIVVLENDAEFQVVRPRPPKEA
jgi:hypothetical protein